MRITKFAHACLLIETGAARILVDPGSWNSLPEAENLSALLITHTHGDHFDIEQVKVLVERNSNVRVITHVEVGAELEKAGIAYTRLADGESIDVAGVSIESCGSRHELIYGEMPKCQNTGYLVAGELYIPGDSLHDIPKSPVRVLALPTGGPWMKLADAIDYAKRVKPSVVFPVHDAVYIQSVQREMVPRLIGGNLEAAGISFIDMAAGDTKEF
ncbi:MAG: putative b-lactamase [Parcubacteria bacterium C7867-001]|nr:MAG: putative b-lactamase [Parcubacteria bacterium C7867-001]